MMLLIALYALLALSFTIGKMLLFYVPPIFLIAIRMSIAGVVILIMNYFMTRTFDRVLDPVVKPQEIREGGLVDANGFAIPENQFEDLTAPNIVEDDSWIKPTDLIFEGSKSSTSSSSDLIRGSSNKNFLSPFGIKHVSDLKIIVLLSFIHILIPYCSEFIALQYIAPSCAALMFNLTPFFSAFFSYLYFDEKMTLKKWLGFLIGLVGIGYFLEPTALSCTGLSNLYPYGLMLLAVVTCALAWIYVRMLIKNSGYSSMYVNGCAMLLGGLLAFPLSWYVEGSVSLPWGNMQSFLMLLAAIIVVANIIFYNLYGFLLKKYTATLLSFIGFITPAFVAFFDWLFLGMHVSYGFFIAIIILGFGIYLFYQEELKQGYIAQ